MMPLNKNETLNETLYIQDEGIWKVLDWGNTDMTLEPVVDEEQIIVDSIANDYLRSLEE